MFFLHDFKNFYYSPFGVSVCKTPMYSANPAIASTATKTTNDATAKAMEHNFPFEDLYSTPTQETGVGGGLSCHGYVSVSEEVDLRPVQLDTAYSL